MFVNHIGVSISRYDNDTITFDHQILGPKKLTKHITIPLLQYYSLQALNPNNTN